MADKMADKMAEKYCLHNAVWNGNADEVRRLIATGKHSYINAKFGQEFGGRKPLNIAILNGNVEILAILIKSGANIDPVNMKNPTTILHYATEKSSNYSDDIFLPY